MAWDRTLNIQGVRLPHLILSDMLVEDGWPVWQPRGWGRRGCGCLSVVCQVIVVFPDAVGGHVEAIREGATPVGGGGGLAPVVADPLASPLRSSAMVTLRQRRPSP